MTFRFVLRANAARSLMGAAVLLLCAADARAWVSWAEKDGWKISTGGWLELDAINDSTRSFVEIVGNAPVERSDAVAGRSGRAQFTFRHSQLAFRIEAPPHSGWKAKGLAEFDFLGFNPAPGTSNTELNFFYSPTVRPRQVFVQADNGGVSVTAGQAWSLFSWQPFYFMCTASAPPTPGVPYIRSPQVRLVHTTDLGEYDKLQWGIAASRPPQRDSGLPALEVGARWVGTGRSAGYALAGSAEHRTQPMSAAVSGTARRVSIPKPGGAAGELLHFPAVAGAANFLLPVVASADGHDPGGTVALMATASAGRGYADQFVGWTGNVSNPLNASAVASSSTVNLDGGFGDFDASGSFQLIQLRSISANLQLHGPTEWSSWLSIGGGQLHSSNVTGLTPGAGGRTSAAKIPYDRSESAFIGVFRGWTPQLRTGLELSQLRTRYADGMLARNNRLQLSLWFLF